MENEIEHMPRYDNTLDQIRERRTPGTQLLTPGIYGYLHSKLSKFEYGLNLFEDVTRYLFSEDENEVLETSVYMYTFFDLAKNDAMQKERQVKEKLIEIESHNVVTGSGKITSERSKARLSDEYKQWQVYLHRIQQIKHDCETMAETMDKMFNKTRTSLKERRIELEPGTGQHRA